MNQKNNKPTLPQSKASGGYPGTLLYPDNKLTMGIVAHVDAGKTTLSEGVLYQNGITRQMGRVDHGDSFLDTFVLEKNRGITIFSKQAIFPLGDKEVTLLDTPGHVDFSAEMERTLQVLDYAILLISGPDGVTGQVLTLWELLSRYHVPTFIFINKMDQQGMDLSAIMEEVQARLSAQCVLAGSEAFYEKAALCDEALLEAYLETGKVSENACAGLIKERKLFPCYYGSALKMQGVDTLLEGLANYTISPNYGSDFGAIIYKISRDEQGNRLTHMKITGGSLSVKEQIGESKVHQIRIYNGKKYEAVQQVSAGTVCAVTGFADTFCGQGLGFEPAGIEPYLDTVLSYEVLLPPDWEPHEAYEKFLQLSEELPELHASWSEESSCLRIRMMGEIQGEILKSLVSERFGKSIEFGEDTVLYKETVVATVEGVGHFEPLRHYAEVHLLLTPLPSGSGIVLDTACSEDTLDRNWQRLVMTHLKEKVHTGILTNSPLTDMKITLTTGRAHVKHTEGGDFRQATYRALRHGLRKAGCRLLEPYYDYRLELPTDFVGRAMNDIQNMHGTCEPSSATGKNTVLTGRAPVSTMKDYQKDVTSYSKGQGRLYCTLAGYFPCHNEEEVVQAVGYEADRDLENPSDSIFCKSGSGVSVPWQEVEQYMHLPLFWQPETIQKNEGSVRGGSESRQYSDEELEAVFKQTYGTSKRETSRFKKSARIITAESGFSGPRIKSAYNNASAEEVLLIDGYNMIFAWEELKDMAALSLASARDLLIEILGNYQGYKENRIIVVFDGYKKPGNPGTTQTIHNMQIIYTKEGETADQFIEKFVLEHVKKLRITVATSDGLEQMMIFGQGALRMSARELRMHIMDTNEEIRQKFLHKF
ncbi:translation factor GTPase family protein [Senimuribacter intestinalis]|uniref:translation factor GTPase family protein n=1 Tax=Senimuribacter intestinalis TaxID=2941507 RepID=UPI00203F183D|nr:TetM/TetW/TetO/TetS family tetracycline resistance ribosomal protection protein [Senimuribacter intestinalis]